MNKKRESSRLEEGLHDTDVKRETGLRNSTAVPDNPPDNPKMTRDGDEFSRVPAEQDIPGAPRVAREERGE